MGPRVLDHVMKVLEHVLKCLICSQVDINNMQFGFRPGDTSTKVIYISHFKCKRNISFGKIKSALLLLTLKRPLTRYLAPYSGGL